jgi:hypothetical protein
LPPFPEFGLAPRLPGAAEADDDCDSDDSADQDITLASARRLNAAADWMRQQAPTFLCGIAVTWFSSLFFWRSDTSALQSELAAARLLLQELRHMSDALHAEVGEARRLLAAVDASKGAAGGATGHVENAVEPRNLASAVHVLSPESHSSWQQVSEQKLSDALSHEVPPFVEPWLVQVIFAAVLFFLDVGLVYFCLRQCASPAVKEQINDLLLRLLLYFGIDSHLAEHSRKLDGPAGKQAADHAAGNDETSTTRVEPSAVDAFLVRRRDGIDLAPVQRQQLQRQAEQLRDIHSHFSSVALAVTSIAGVIGVRMAGKAAAFIGLYFLNHLVMYAVLTVRICLIVFLVLF